MAPYATLGSVPLVLATCRAAAVCALCILVMCTRAHAQTPQVPATRQIHALLIGVTDYSEARLAPLHGPRNDVELMREVLATRFAVPAQNIRVRLNPTHSEIEQEFAGLQERVNRDDYVYIHYSGHGSTAPDPGDARGEDQTWVSFGARASTMTGKDHWDVLDKEIGLWLGRLYDITEDVVFVSDSCHSGTVSRGLALGVRNAPFVPQPHPLLAQLPPAPAPTTGVRIGAARDFEPAVELDQRNGQSCDDTQHCYGVFTWHWAQALRESRPGEAWADVFARANARVTTTASVYQRPQMEGRADRTVFGGAYTALRPTVEVLEERAGVVSISAGTLSGVTVGSKYKTDAPAGATPAVLRVTQANPLASELAVESGTVKRGDLVVETVHVYEAPKLRIHVGQARAGEDSALLERVGAALAGSLQGPLSGFEIVTRPEQADWVLQLARPDTGDAAPRDGAARRLPDERPCRTPCPSPQLWVVSRQGLLVNEQMRFDMERFEAESQRLLDNLHALAWAQEVRRLAAHGNGTPLRLAVTVLRPPAGDAGKCVVGADTRSRWTRFGPAEPASLAAGVTLNDCLAFEIENRDADRTWYGYVVAVGPDLKVQPVLPDARAGSDAARIPPGGRLSLPDLFYRLSGAGQETLMLLASDGPVRVQALQQAGLRGEPQSQLEALLSVAGSRRGEVETTGTWGASGVDLWVAPPGTAR